MKIKSLIQRFLILVGSFLFLFFIIELFFRVFYPHSGYSITYASWGWTHTPNTKVTFYNENPRFNFNIFKRPHPIPIRYNSKGLRDFEYGYKKSENIFRILILGDSFAEDMGSFFDNLHVKRLERKLNQKGLPYKVEVINAGHYAFDNAQELMFYLKEGRNYSPDIVILMFNRDTADPAYATLDKEGKLELHYKIFTPSQIAYRWVVSLIRRHSQFGAFILDRSKKVNIFRRFLATKGYSEADKVIPGAQEREADFSKTDKAIWLAFKNTVEDSGGKFIFMNCYVYPNELSGDNTYARNKKFLVDNNILLFENMSTAEEAKKLKDRDILVGRYNKFYDSNRAGYKANEKIAERMMDFLLDNNLLPDKPREGIRNNA